MTKYITKKNIFFALIAAFSCFSFYTCLKNDVASIAHFGIIMVLISAFAMLAMYILCTKSHILSTDFFDGKRTLMLFWAIVALGVAVRIFFCMFTEGVLGDAYFFVNWSQTAATQGLPNAYVLGDVPAAYPPGYILLLAFMAKIVNFLGVDPYSRMGILFVTLPAILSDAAIAVLAFYFLRKKSQITAFVTGLSLMVLPISIFDSGVWKQVDSVLIFPLLLAFVLLYEEKYMVSSIVFAVAVLLKPQALILGPVFLVAFLLPLIVKKEKPLKVFLRTGICGATALLLIWLCSLIFKGEQGLFWIIEKYFVIMDGFPFASVNAANFYSMLGLNFADYTEKSWIFTAQTWGYIFIALATVVLVYFAFQSAKKKSVNIFLLGAFYSLAVFTFAQAMHERYSIIPLIFMIFAWAMIGDKRILKVATVQGVLTFANTLLAFFYMVKFEEMQVLAIGGSMKLISFFQVLLFCYFTYICIDIFTPIISNYRDKTKGKYMTAMTLPDEKPKKLQLTKKDLLFVLVPTLVCAVFSFANLGDFNSPQTGVAIYENSNFEVSFKEGKKPAGVWCFTEIADGTVDFIKKGETEPFASMSAPYSTIFSWNVQNFEQDANEFVINGNNVKLNEMVFVDENDNLIKPTYFSPEIASLFDEQYLKPKTITYKNGMYFDEVYHARTAYEQRNGLYIFETTHPPLGKVLIELGTYIFGMNPFGWRFAGVFLGVLLLPIMYLLAKSLFASSEIALFCQLLLMFDCLRYTQSRIATIDTPVVFFILLSYLFMVNFVKKDFVHDKIHTLLLPFFACGISFGLGCATKWTGIYSGAGLALILLLYLVKSYKEIDIDEKKLYINRLAKIILCGIAFFVIIPIGIYILSYIPLYINSDTPFSLKLVWDNQIGMFDYHSKLTATHGYSSPWWSWPFSMRPVWYSIGSKLPSDVASTISAMGNLVVWLAGFGAVVALIASKLCKKTKFDTGTIILVGLAAQFLPWVLVTRATFLYHYFASVMFLILALGWIVYKLKPVVKNIKAKSIALVCTAALFFCMFFPVISGMTVSQWYVKFLQWMPTWTFLGY